MPINSYSYVPMLTIKQVKGHIYRGIFTQLGHLVNVLINNKDLDLQRCNSYNRFWRITDVRVSILQ